MDGESELSHFEGYLLPLVESSRLKQSRDRYRTQLIYLSSTLTDKRSQYNESDFAVRQLQK